MGRMGARRGRKRRGSGGDPRRQKSRPGAPRPGRGCPSPAAASPASRVAAPPPPPPLPPPSSPPPPPSRAASPPPGTFGPARGPSPSPSPAAPPQEAAAAPPPPRRETRPKRKKRGLCGRTGPPPPRGSGRWRGGGPVWCFFFKCSFHCRGKKGEKATHARPLPLNAIRNNAHPPWPASPRAPGPGAAAP